MHDERSFLERGQELTAEGWGRITEGVFWRRVVEHGFDRELYLGLMREIYHTTRHNAQNQALASTGVRSDRLGLLRYCLRHSLEEAGHDLMVLHDLAAIGIAPEEVTDRRPLPETEAFIAYLYRVASERDATARLGYSFWAESCYPYIEVILQAMRTSLDLDDREMTFFVAHAEIDERHAREVCETAAEWCATPAQQAEFLVVLEQSLHLQGQVLEGVARTCPLVPLHA